ncbi:MAG: hypothetical protein A3E74_05660 [Omnitrophica bacterium RIFCSPHIGHO2_12_FULL_44_12]|nr:MAG: hypothetical protein A3B72_08750 [Omnitrophica bacterium RIFCSPHIGHO2_02_FULL_45_28]OGW90698.1 MAG: hypothetical protein A3E74_05660 [Omnitrophica bacterium RIFCSPHIGHO2_12_FULL_44_12]
MKINRAIRIESILTAITFLFNFGIRLDLYAETAGANQQILNSKVQQIKYPAELLRAKIKRANTLIDKLETTPLRTSEKSELSDIVGSLDELKTAVEFQVESELSKFAGSPEAREISKRHQEFIHQFRENFSAYKQALKSAQNLNPLSRFFKEKHETIERLTGSAPRAKPTDEIRLPHSQTDRLEKRPFIDPAHPVNPDESQEKPRTFIHLVDRFSKTAHADSPACTTIGDAPPEIKLHTPRIDALLVDLKTPAEIYEYVVNHIKYEPYFGSLKGSEQTLREGAGNDVDQASLLIALLRSKGIPAEYVFGIVEIPITQAQNLVGVDQPSAVASVFIKNGIPVEEISTGGGSVSAVKIQHAWVRANIGYLPYRGTTDESNKLWIDLDPSFKLNDFNPNQNVTQKIGVDPVTFLTQTKQQGTINDAQRYVTDLPQQSFIIPRIKDWGLQIRNYMDTNDQTLDTLFRTAVIQEEGFQKLPASLPYKVIQETQAFACIDNAPAIPLRHQIRIRLTNPVDGTNLLDPIEKALPELAEKRITIAYRPATTADETILGQHLADTTLPVYLVKVKPQLTISNGAGPAVFDSITAIAMGAKQTLTIDFIHPDGSTETATKELAAGSYYSLVLDFQKINSTILDEQKNKLETAAGNENLLAETLTATGTNYFYQLDAFNHLTAGSLDVMITREPSMAVTSYNLNVTEVLGLPFTAEADGIQLDILRDAYVPISVTGNSTAEKQFMTTSAITSSAIASIALEQSLGQSAALSAAQTIVSANTLKKNIYSVDQNNVGSVTPVLESANVPADVITDIQNAAHANLVITIPEGQMTAGGYTEAGYAVLDPDTGAAGFFLESGLNGGKVKLNYLIPAQLVLFTGAGINYAAMREPPTDWLRVVYDSQTEIGTAYLPAAASINEWFKQTATSLDDAATVTSILAIMGIVSDISNKPHISNVKTVNEFFSPKDPNDCASLTFTDLATHNECMGIEYSVTRGASSLVTIKNSADQTVKTFPNQTTSHIQIIWDGKNDSAVLVPDGIYTYEINAVKNTIPAEQKTGAIVVDKQAPTATVTSPATIPAGNVFIKGTAFDEANFDYYQVQIVKDLDFAHPLLDESYLNAVETENALALWNAPNPSVPTPGYQVILTAYDKAKNATVVTHDFTLDKFKAIQILTPKAPDTTFTRFVDTTIQVNDSNITQMQLTVGTKTISLPFSSVSAGTYSFQWSPAQQGVTPGSYTMTVLGKNADGTQVGNPDSVGIIIQNFSAPVQITSASVTPQEFDPTIDSPVQINAALSGISDWKITIHQRPNTDGLPLGTIVYDSGVQHTNTPTASWNGKDLANQFVSPGQTLDGYIWYMKTPAANIDDPDNRFFWFWFTIYIEIPASSPDDPLLTAAITSPQNGEQLENAKIALLGKVTDGEDSSVLTEILVKPASGTEWNIASSEQVETGKLQATLGTINAMTLADDVYDVMVRVTDSAQHIAYSPINTYTIFSKLKIGNFARTFVDFATTINGFPINVTRIYNSLNSLRQGSFGYGWDEKMMDMKMTSAGRYDKMITNQDGTKVLHAWNPRPMNSIFNGGLDTLKEGNFDNTAARSGDKLYIDYGVSQKLYVTQDTVTGRWFDMDFNSVERIENSRYTIVTRDGSQYQFDDSGYLESFASPMEKSGGLKIRFDANGVYKNGSPTPIIQITDRDSANRIKQIVAYGSITFDYLYCEDLGNPATNPDCEAGDLYTVRRNWNPFNPPASGGPLGKQTKYVYGDGSIAPIHYLREVWIQTGWDVTNPVMIKETSLDYENGVLSGSTDTNGKNIESIHDFEHNKEIATDAMDRTTTVEYDDRGLIKSECNNLNQCTTYTYDKYGNQKTMTDPMGAVTQYEYGEMFAVSGPLGAFWTGWDWSEIRSQVPDALFAVPGLVQIEKIWNRIPHPTQIFYPDGSYEVSEYNKKGLLISKRTSLSGNSEGYDYDSGGRVRAETGNLYTTEYTYSSSPNEDGLRTEVKNTLTGEIEKTEYVDGRPDRIITNYQEAPSTHTGITNTYSPEGYVTTQTPFSDGGSTTGKIISATYDELGNMTSFGNDTGATTIDWTPDGKISSVSTGGTLQCETEYFQPGESPNDYGLNKPKLITYYHPANVVQERFTYDKLTTTHIIIFSDETNGDLSDNPKSTTIQNLDGSIIYEEATDGTITEQIPDELGRLSEVYVNGILQAKFIYDNSGRIVSEYDAKKNTQIIRDYDPLSGRLLSVIDPQNGQVDYSYYSDGSVKSITDQYGTVIYEYSSGKLVKMTYNDGHFVTVEYSADGRMLARTDENGNRLVYDYYQNGSLRAILQDLEPGDGDPIELVSYDENASLNRYTRTDALGHQVTYDHAPTDPPGATFKITLHNPSGDLNQIFYEPVIHSPPQIIPNWPSWAPAGESGTCYIEETVQNFNGDHIIKYYGESGNLVAKYVEEGDLWIIYEIDLSDPLASGMRIHKGNSSTETYSYKEVRDNQNRLESIYYDDGKRISYQYDNNNRVEHLAITGSTGTLYDFTYVYNPTTGFLTNVRDPLGGVTYIYDRGFKKQERFDNGITTDYDYDSRGRLNKITTKKNGSELRRLEYKLTPTSLVEEARVFENGSGTPARAISYTYDPLGRVTEETDITSASSIPLYSYTYYLNGSRKTKVDHSTNQTHTYYYNETDRLTREEVNNGLTTTIYNYEFDVNGNLTHKWEGSITTGILREHYVYDGENHLLRVEFDPGRGTQKIVRYNYTAEGNRYEKQVDSNIPTRYLVDPTQAYSQILMEYNAAGSETFYLHGAEGPILLINPSGHRFYLHQGRNRNTAFTTDALGTIVEEYDYDAFGGPKYILSNPAVNNPYLATGEYYDADSKLYDLRARAYSPGLGQFLSRDSYERGFYDTGNLPYASNHLLNARDPSGHWNLYTVMSTVSMSLTLSMHYYMAGGFYNLDFAISDLQLPWYQELLLSFSIDAIATGGARLLTSSWDDVAPHILPHLSRFWTFVTERGPYRLADFIQSALKSRNDAKIFMLNYIAKSIDNITSRVDDVLKIETYTEIFDNAIGVWNQFKRDGIQSSAAQRAGQILVEATELKNSIATELYMAVTRHINDAGSSLLPKKFADYFRNLQHATYFVEKIQADVSLLKHAFETNRAWLKTVKGGGEAIRNVIRAEYDRKLKLINFNTFETWLEMKANNIGIAVERAKRALIHEVLHEILEEYADVMASIPFPPKQKYPDLQWIAESVQRAGYTEKEYFEECVVNVLTDYIQTKVFGTPEDFFRNVKWRKALEIMINRFPKVAETVDTIIKSVDDTLDFTKVFFHDEL